MLREKNACKNEDGEVNSQRANPPVARCDRGILVISPFSVEVVVGVLNIAVVLHCFFDKSALYQS